ncbi:pyridoxal phosphate-dependent aminotransferase [Leucothrix pacifica]|uniref:Aminotransferase n=1 Tax=Leucothrix pacifica TaxID=1247513 RepID=A0A317C7X8_9GAMM|nr:pyridoxal phosphate-dependent aminotransferase [Leucothrix pacifica]PWQ92410.1 aminotransferase [Leucothrix pacifica]
MKYAAVTQRLATLGSEKWVIHDRARQLIASGKDVVELTIGEPDVATPDYLIETASAAMQQGRTAYSNGRGEDNLREVLAERYSQRLKRTITDQQILCFPGTQTALYAVMQGIAESGDEVLVGDPMYATYEGVIASSGATTVPVPLRPENDFRLSAADLEARVTEKTTAILMNTPHNPTGAVLTAQDIEDIAEVAVKHDLWLLVDEVYEELVFSDAIFVSPLVSEAIAERVIVVSSISKSHAAPGFRSGWCVGSEEFCGRLLPLSETMLFGNQPFIADMTAQAVSAPSPIAEGMVARFEARAHLLAERLHAESNLKVSLPKAGMFALVDVSATGMSGYDYAVDLLENAGVAVMPGSAFGETLVDWVRVALTTEDDLFVEGCDRMIKHANCHANPHASSSSNPTSSTNTINGE